MDQRLFQHRGVAVTDSSWQLMQYDIHAVADNQPAVYLRWGYSVSERRVRLLGLEHRRRLALAQDRRRPATIV